MEKSGTDSCVKICDARRLVDAIDRQLSDLGLIYSGRTYPGKSSGRNVEYSGHSVDSKTKISGNRLKGACFKGEAEFRLTFVPIIKREGKIIDPVSRQRDEGDSIRVFRCARP